MTAPYIDVNLTLDSNDLIQIETLIKLRIDDLQKCKDENADAGWFVRERLNDSIAMWADTQKKIKAARKEVKRIKKEADAAFYASLKSRK